MLLQAVRNLYKVLGISEDLKIINLNFMPYNSDDVKSIVVNKATQAIGVIIAHPGAGRKIAIDYICLNANGGANVVTLTGTVAPAISLAANATLVLDNAAQDPKGVFHCNTDQAFSLTLSNATTIAGYIKYRIING